MPKNPPDLTTHTYNDFIRRFRTESDRAAAVLAGAYLDAFLEQLLRGLLVSGPWTDQLFEQVGGLGSFSGKIAMVCSLGIAEESVCRDLDLVRKIRNHFAHHVFEATFDTSPVRDWCAEIKLAQGVPLEPRLQTPRHRYMLAIALGIPTLVSSDKVPAELRRRIFGRIR